MALFKCKMCGGDLEIDEGVTIAECEYCGTKQTVPKAMDENLHSLFNRANTLRIKSEFDKAEKLYEKIIQFDSTQSEAYWGLILCKYGIEYVDDPATFKKIPTCHRASYESIIADDDYKSALANADMSQRTLYEEQAKEIDRIQKEILALAQKEESYDVFICYKETDASGQRTQDSVIANDIYYQLTNEGFKVFYAAITLEGKLGSAYEPIIFAALNSAKVMLCIGTKPEYFNAVWVKNEWSRFLKIIKKDRSKLLIPCYRDMDAYELPEEFAHLQAQDMSKIGFINDIVRGIKKVVKKDEPKATVIKETVVSSSVTPSSSTAPLLKRAFMFLEDGDWESADEYCEKVLDQDPECARAYLGKLMVELEVKKQEHLQDLPTPFDDNHFYQKTLRFADAPLTSTLCGYIEHINTRNETARLEELYQGACYAMQRSANEIAYKNAANLFEPIRHYKDSAALYEECLNLAEAARKDAILGAGKNKASQNTPSTLHEAIELFQTISGWKDADEMQTFCQNRILEIEEQKEADRKDSILTAGKNLLATQTISEQKEALKLFESISGWKNANDLIFTCKQNIETLKQKNKRNVKATLIAIPVVVAVIAIAIAIGSLVNANTRYNNAMFLMESGDLEAAHSAFQALGNYKDSKEKAGAVRLQKNKSTLKNCQVGSYVKFGAYEQDNNKSNGQEEIEWLVLAKENNKILVISKHALDCVSYHKNYADITWETCDLRAWLNDDFFESAFSKLERDKILKTSVPATRNPDYSTNPGNAVEDTVFLLSIAEVQQYSQLNARAQCGATAYAIARGAFVSNTSKTCWWWLRSPGFDQKNVAGVNSNGKIDTLGNYAYNDGNAVRPAMWIDLSN